ncbi:RidA family protein [Elioraea thermophila]|uniref:RidA family protein n=1 Tax=Elioraea thermophila TaxID=2185104 RepID=UPI000DF2AAEE|nr:RidA family protein [Elioraea thermophila]
MTLETILPAGWPRPKGYANGMVGAGRVLFVGGQVGWDENGRFADGFIAQTERALLNVVTVVRSAGGSVEDIARLVWYVVDIDLYRRSLPELGPAYRRVMGKHFPTMAVVGVTALVEPAALVEIEATAVLAS